MPNRLGGGGGGGGEGGGGGQVGRGLIWVTYGTGWRTDQVPILVSLMTPYCTVTWVFRQTTLDFPFLQHIANI